MDEKPTVNSLNMDSPTKSETSSTDQQTAQLIAMEMQHEASVKSETDTLRSDADFATKPIGGFDALSTGNNITFLTIIMDIFFIGYARRTGGARVRYMLILASIYVGLIAIYKIFFDK